MNVSLRPNCKKHLHDVSLTAVTTADGPRPVECKACHDQCMIFSYNLQEFWCPQSLLFLSLKILKILSILLMVTFLSTFLSDPPPSPTYKRFCPKLITDHYWLLCCCGRCIKIEPWPGPVGQ